jgi:hypothetical protein
LIAARPWQNPFWQRVLSDRFGREGDSACDARRVRGLAHAPRMQDPQAFHQALLDGMAAVTANR